MTTAIPAIAVRKLSKEFDAGRLGKVQAVEGMNFVVNPSEILAIVGPSGCGKSTILNLIGGFETPSRGEVLVYGELVQRPGPDRGMVFQSPGLFPWFTVFDNIVYGPRRRGVPRPVYTADARQLIRAVGLPGFERHYPYQLSGGMAQRVALARALICRPRVLLLDEPFGALDAQTRLGMQRLLLDIWRAYRSTVVLVTHDVEEAVFLADRIIVMSERPGSLKAEIRVDLDRMRDIEVLTSARFAAIRREILALVFGGSRSSGSDVNAKETA